MTIDELIERLKALPKDVRRRPLMDGKPAVGYRLAPLDHISVEKVLASNDGFCGMTDPKLTDAENVAEAGDRYGMSARIERRALAFFDGGETDMDSTLDKRIAAMRGSLMDTALEAAESRGQRLAGVAHVLYALYRDDGFAGRLLRAHGLESAEIRRLMGTVPNMPLADGGKPVPNLSTRRILKYANDTLEVLRYLQGNDQVAGLLASHGIGKPDCQPTQAQVLAAAQAGIEAAGPLALGRDYGMDPGYLARVRLMLEAALDGDSEVKTKQRMEEDESTTATTSVTAWT